MNILLTITPIFIILLFCAVLQKVGYIKDTWVTTLNEYVLKIGFPILLISSISKATFSLNTMGSLVLINSLIILSIFFTLIIANKFFNIDKKAFRTIWMCLPYGNVAYLGIPILQAVYGKEILAEVSLIIATYLFWIFSIGIGYLDYTQLEHNTSIFNTVKRTLIKTFKNPLLIGVMIGVIIMMLNIKIHPVLTKVLDMMSASVTPVVLVVLGIFCGKMQLGKIKDWAWPIIASLAKLIIIPCIFLIVVRGLNLNIPKLYITISILQMAMPLGLTPISLAKKYDLDEDFITKTIVLGTLLSMGTLIGWMMYLE